MLNVLKNAMEDAKNPYDFVASFYDPIDPRRDLSALFKEYKDSLKDGRKYMPYLHIGVCYGTEGHQAHVKTGHLYIVKNRLPPPQVWPDQNMPCKAPLTKEMITQERDELEDP